MASIAANQAAAATCLHRQGSREHGAPVVLLTVWMCGSSRHPTSTHSVRCPPVLLCRAAAPAGSARLKGTPLRHTGHVSGFAAHRLSEFWRTFDTQFRLP